jgi:hypothetical protein
MSTTQVRSASPSVPALAGYAHALLRIVASYLLLTHASAKLFHVPHIAMFDGLPLFSLLGAAGIIELVGRTGVRLFHRTCTEWAFPSAAPESGRAGRAALVHLSVHRGGGTGRVEHRQSALKATWAIRRARR